MPLDIIVECNTQRVSECYGREFDLDLKGINYSHLLFSIPQLSTEYFGSWLKLISTRFCLPMKYIWIWRNICHKRATNRDTIFSPWSRIKTRWVQSLNKKCLKNMKRKCALQVLSAYPAMGGIHEHEWKETKKKLKEIPLTWPGISFVWPSGTWNSIRGVDLDVWREGGAGATSTLKKPLRCNCMISPTFTLLNSGSPNMGISHWKWILNFSNHTCYGWSICILYISSVKN